MALTVGVLRETQAGERRVALTPEVVGRLRKAGYEALVERGAGEAAFLPDAAYEAAGARLVERAEALAADLLPVVHPPEVELDRLKAGAVVVGLLAPLDRPGLSASLAAQGVTAFAMELVPRITRAQKMDALSAMSTIAGYKAALLAAEALPRFFPLLTTAAGTIRPAQVLVLGAGVAGLQALATARRLGAVTSAYDVRAAAREQVESVGARFVELELETADAEERGGYARALAEEEQARQVELLARYVARADAIITTALVPGRPAPVLLTEAGVEAMAPGSVVIDLAAASGGNCTLTRPDEAVRHGGVQILGPTNLAASMPLDASQMYARTVAALVLEFTREGVFAPDFEDEIVQGACVTHGGEVVHERVRPLVTADT